MRAPVTGECLVSVPGLPAPMTRLANVYGGGNAATWRAAW